MSTRYLANSAVPLGPRRNLERGEGAEGGIEELVGIPGGFASEESIEGLPDELGHRNVAAFGGALQGPDLVVGEIDLGTPHTAEYTS